MKVVLFICSIFIFSTCTDVEYKIPVPVLSTNETLGNDATGVTFVGTILSVGEDTEGMQAGFVWSNLVFEPTIEGSNVIYVNLDPKTGTYSTRITHDIFPNAKNSVRAFVKTKKNVVYGNFVIFIPVGYPAPNITSLSPTSGSAGTHVTLIGENFWSKNNVTVTLGNNPVFVESSINGNAITIIIPSNIIPGEYPILVKCAAKTSPTPVKFTVK